MYTNLIHHFETNLDILNVVIVGFNYIVLCLLNDIWLRSQQGNIEISVFMND